ncbi:MAG: LamG-like jellyroll fold domain-containing protein [Armatimonadota bacterium]
MTVVHAAAPGGAFSDELSVTSYDCTLGLTPAKAIAAGATVTLLLDWLDAGNHTRIKIIPATITIDVVAKGKTARVQQFKAGVTPGQPYPFTVLRRGSWLGVICSGALVFRGEVARPTGAQAGVTATGAWSVDSARIQRLEPVVFADNFMRTADEPGAWAIRSGEWKLQSAWDQDPHGNTNRFTFTDYAQNPFAWVGRSTGAFALCTAGEAFWEDYTFTTAVCPPATGAVGVLVNAVDGKNGLLLRWSPANDRGAQGNRLILYRMSAGQLTKLSEEQGGYVPKQWYQLSVVSNLEGVTVLVDKQPRLTVKDVSPWRGGVGLYAEGKEAAVFDDITVYGRGVKKDLLTENRVAQANQRFTNDSKGMKEWSTELGEWTSFPDAPGTRLSRQHFYGDHWITLTLKPRAVSTSTAPLAAPAVAKVNELSMVLNSDGKEITSGYRAVLQLTAEGQKPAVTLYRNTTKLASKVIATLTPNEAYALRLARRDNRVWVELDGKTVLEGVDKAPLAGLLPAYRASGCYAGVDNVVVVGRNQLDYIFADAPVDWLAQGTWIPTIRWSCSPSWSFLAGWSRGEAALWHKQRFTGDQSFEAFVAPKMEYPRQRALYEFRYRDMAITICGDGRNPRSGYSGIFMASGSDGSRQERTVLLRNGVEVASIPVPTAEVPNKDNSHRNWFDLVLYKRGSTVEFWVEGVKRLTYTDPNPLDGGVPAIWTQDNGISIARARLHFANAPQPRTDRQVILGDPWHPEWANVKTPLPLDFSGAWSTSGKPVRVQATPEEAPAGDEKAMTTSNEGTIFTPLKAGQHWYRISAGDGENQSADFHLALPVFDPALGRDDSQALVLYRFTEGKGNTVKDYSKVTPTANIMILKDTPVTWLPGQGLQLRGTTPMMTASAVDKLMAIARNKACTIEMWISADTQYPPQGWAGTMLAWETTDQRNFVLGHAWYKIVMAPRGSKLVGTDWNPKEGWLFNTGLSHVVITWDGTNMRCYVNGEIRGERWLPWNVEQWTNGCPLLLGNSAVMDHNFIGTYYLVAIHDRCFTDAQVLRHYNAGPSAK